MEQRQNCSLRMIGGETSLTVPWLRPCASTGGGTGLISGWGTKILHATWLGQKKNIKASGPFSKGDI